MHFEYEITADEYVAAHLLLYKQQNHVRKRFASAIGWILAGFFFWFVTWNERVLGLGSVLLVFTGAWWIYVGVVRLFPAMYYRREYRKERLADEKYSIDVNEGGFTVTGDLGSGILAWR